MILKIFSPKKFGKNICVFCPNCCYFLQKFDHNIGFWENANFFAENLQKSQKIVIITSTLCFSVTRCFFSFRVWLNLRTSFVSASEEASLRQSQPGLPDGLFSKPNPNLGKFLRALYWTMFVGVLYCYLVYFTAFGYILLPFGIFYGNLEYFFPGLVCCTKKNLATLVTTCLEVSQHSHYLHTK
jgi:hypothetical protein